MSRQVTLAVENCRPRIMRVSAGMCRETLAVVTPLTATE
jgi:hypothetical protein